MIKLNQFRTNNLDLKVQDIVFNFKESDKDGIKILKFSTKDKYHIVYANGYSYNGDSLYSSITIEPCLYDEQKNFLYDTDMDSYFKHPDYYYIELLFKLEWGSQSLDIPLKHEYLIAYIPNDIVFDYAHLTPVGLL